MSAITDELERFVNRYRELADEALAHGTNREASRAFGKFVVAQEALMLVRSIELREAVNA